MSESRRHENDTTTLIVLLMTSLLKIFIGSFFGLLGVFPGTSYGAIDCVGRQYPATVTTVLARSAWLIVDLGFGMTFRGVIELDGTKEPSKPLANWYGVANAALHQKLDGKTVTLCVVDRMRERLISMSTAKTSTKK